MSALAGGSVPSGDEYRPLNESEQPIAFDEHAELSAHVQDSDSAVQPSGAAPSDRRGLFISFLTLILSIPALIGAW